MDAGDSSPRDQRCARDNGFELLQLLPQPESVFYFQIPRKTGYGRAQDAKPKRRNAFAR
jgi:hypothetical protein